MIDINELRRLAQAALVGPDGVSLNWIKLLQDFQQKASPAVISELLDRLEAAESARRDDYQNWMTALDRNAELLTKLEAAEKSDAESIAMYRKARDERDALRAMLRAALDVLEEVKGNINPERGYADELEADVERAIATIALPGAKTMLPELDEVTVVLDRLDDYIARIEGNDRGACHPINLIRRYLLDAAGVGGNK